ncbi:glycosyltransferase family 32 protein [Falsiroseomonas selenitidurans]|uniref:Alpha 1,4-glycosyltransferase domain-containing protein n=1 Tax=Falsiroseomonas selenitidurans TaxID=2716335 RepID=A0ABX1EDJ0_9PROT|nr:hypothetical protein [Falsiroseomonas selenitidurans]NKC33833.1 hypothetical protein [Falsiroseomonas selenitidurans]
MALLRSFWHGGPLSPYEVLCLTSFLHHGHAVELFTYDPAIRAPDGVVRRDAAEILPDTPVFAYATGLGRGSFAAFSNLFRYRLMQREPGWWVDADVLCLSPTLPEAASFFAWEAPDQALVGTAVMRLGPGDPLTERLLAAQDAFQPDQPWASGGPQLVTAAVRATGRTAQDWRICYPWHFSRAFDVFDPAATPAVEAAVQGAQMQHLWHEMFRCGGLPKHLRPPPGSYLDGVCRRHGVVFPEGPPLVAEDVRRSARVVDLAYATQSAEAARNAAEAGRAVAEALVQQLQAACDAAHAAARQWREALEQEAQMRAALVTVNAALAARLEQAERPLWRRWRRPD